MIEFENMVYLDVQKTGSSYVAAFLRQFAATKELRTERHKPVEQRCDGKLYIISCRDPLSQYLSLYSYGCGGAGGIHKKLSESGKRHLYDKTLDGFSTWLRMIMTPEGCQEYLGGRKPDPMFELAGFQTVRFMRMALPRDEAVPRRERSEAGLKNVLRRKLERKSLMDVVLKQETLNENLRSLVNAHPDRFANVDKVDGYLANQRKINASREIDIDTAKLPEDLLSYVQEREWLYFENLGYQRYI